MRERDEEEDEKSERERQSDGRGEERMENRGLGGGEIEHERLFVQRARPTGSSLLSSPLFSSSFLSSPLLSSLHLILASRGFVTRVSPSAQHLSFSVFLFLASHLAWKARYIVHAIVYIALQKFCTLAKMRDGNVE